MSEVRVVVSLGGVVEPGKTEWDLLGYCNILICDLSSDYPCIHSLSKFTELYTYDKHFLDLSFLPEHLKINIHCFLTVLCILTCKKRRGSDVPT